MLPLGVVLLLTVTDGGAWLAFLLASRRGPLTAVTLALTIVVVGFASIRVVASAMHPGRSLRLVLFLAAHALSVLIADFAFIYWRGGTRANWGMPLSHIDALFLTIGTLTTAGTGGIAPHTEWARGMLTIQMTVDIVSVTLITGLVIARLTAGRAAAAQH
jgi:Ion channel